VKEPLPDRLKPLLGECWPAYEMLRQHALRPMPADSVLRCVHLYAVWVAFGRMRSISEEDTDSIAVRMCIAVTLVKKQTQTA
jgi:hypothetical protein